MTEHLVGLGAGGHARVVVEILRLVGQYEIIGLLDQNADLHSTDVFGVPVLGSDDMLPEMRNRGVTSFFIGLGSSSDLQPRRRLYEMALNHDLTPVSAIHPAAILSTNAAIGDGFTAMALSVVNVNAQVGNNVILNTGAVVEHDCIIGDHCHMATGATVAGGVRIGEGTHIGAGAVIRQGIRIGDNAVVGAGAVVVNDVSDDETVVGNPARPIL